MSAFSEASKLYDPKVLGNIIATCATNGFIYAEEDVFVCAIETKSSLEVDTKDTWHVCIASGNVGKALKAAPVKRYLSFERFDDKVRLYSFSRIRRLIWATSETNGLG